MGRWLARAVGLPRVSSLKANVLANLTGQGWIALVQLVVVPIYLNLLGVEAYGLIGFYATLLVTIQVLDLGLGQTMTRELARRTAISAEGNEFHDLVGTVEKVYWGIAATVCALLFLTLPFMAKHIIEASHLSRETLQNAVILMAVLVALQLTINLYQCGLMGLEKFALVNQVRVIAATASAVGGVLILLYVSRSIVALFVWHTCVYLAHAASSKVLLWRSLPGASRAPGFRLDLLKNLWRFAAGMSGITAVAIIVTQLDKWILINLLSLEDFGYYAVATAVSTSLYLFIGPMFSVLFTRFSSLAAKSDEGALTHVYRGGTQILVVAVVPAALVLSLFSYDVLNIWTRNPQVSAQAAPIVSILVIGTAVNGLMNVPFALLLAHGWARLVLGINLVAIVFLVPAILVLTLRFGPIGAAIAWLAFNLLFALLAVPLTHKRFFVGGAMSWLGSDVLLGAGAAILVLGAARLAYPHGMSEPGQAFFIIVSYALSVSAAALCGSQTREWVLKQARTIHSKIG